MESVLRWMFHSYLAMKLLLCALISNGPRPPSFLGKQTVLQATKADLLFRISPVHRKVWQMLTICVITSPGMGKMLSQSAPCHKEPIGSTQPSQHN